MRKLWFIFVGFLLKADYNQQTTEPKNTALWFRLCYEVTNVKVAVQHCRYINMQKYKYTSTQIILSKKPDEGHLGVIEGILSESSIKQRKLPSPMCPLVSWKESTWEDASTYFLLQWVWASWLKRFNTGKPCIFLLDACLPRFWQNCL